MESKNESKSDGENVGRELVSRMCEHAFKVLNTDMDEFFELHVDLFEQDEADLTSGRGETLQQYNIYKKYQAVLEEKFDDFSLNEGFASSYECFNAVKDAVAVDIMAQQKMMVELRKRLLSSQNSFQNVESNVRMKEEIDEGKEDSDTKEECKMIENETKENKDDESETVTVHTVPIMLFFQPVSLQNIVETTLSIGEYQSFSYVMRLKVRQRKLLLQMKKKIASQSENSSLRKSLFISHDYISIYAELIDRLCGLTPNRSDIEKYTRSSFTSEKWDEIFSVQSGADLDKRKDLFKRLLFSILMRFAQVGSYEDLFKMNKHCGEFSAKIESVTTESDMSQIAMDFLKMGHDFIDEIEEKIYQSLTSANNKNKNVADAKSSHYNDDDRKSDKK